MCYEVNDGLIYPGIVHSICTGYAMLMNCQKSLG
uniref:Uncharacterized protein n=1 Tax=Setaria italica TaxID=4555 RepID=K3Y3V6_SETIT